MSDWHEWRGKGIGGSDVGAILGIDPFATPYSVYADKVHGVGFAGNEYTEFGKRAERMLADWFHDRTGLYVVGEQTWCEHPEHPWQRATVDGFVAESPLTKHGPIVPDKFFGVWEAKTTGLSSWADGIPPHIQAQVQWQLHVTGLDRAWVGVLHGRRFEVYELEADPDDQAFIVAEVDAFWNDVILAQQAPPIDGTQRTTDTLRALYPAHLPGLAVEVPEQLMRDLVEVRATTAAWTERKTLLENQLRALLEDAEIGTVNGVKVATYRRQVAQVLDTKRLEADEPELCDRYRKDRESRPLNISYRQDEEDR